MNVNAAKALITITWLGAAGFAAIAGCSSEDPPLPPDGSANQTSMVAGNATTSPATTSPATTAAGTPTATSAVTSNSGVGATTAGATVSGTASAVSGVTASTGAGGASATLVTSTTSTTSNAATGAGGSAAASASVTTGGAATLTDEQCQGISNGAECASEGTCAPRSCGLADTGTRTCGCGPGDAECTSTTCWDCTSCSWTEPYPEVAIPPETPLTACASDVADEVACSTRAERCLQGEEVCACWLEDDAGLIWDCDSTPSFWP